MSNCKKCGKEIGEGELCEECKAKGGNNTLYILVGIACVIIAALIVGIVFFKILPGQTAVGNSTGNLLNYGYSVEANNYIFYAVPNSNAKYTNIYRMDKNGSNEKLICEKQWNVYSLNYWDNKLYFIAYESDSTSGTGTSTIYSMDADGNNIKEITKDITTSTDRIFIKGNEIYYMNDSYNICKVSVNGGEPTLVDEGENGFVAISGDWILYIDYSAEKQQIYKRKFDGSEKGTIGDELVYDMNIVNDEVYYVTSVKDESGNTSGKFCKVPLKGGDVTVIKDEELYNVVISGDYAYYMKYVDIDNADNPYLVGLYKIKLDGSGEQKLMEFRSYSTFLNVVGDWIMYSDQDDEAGYMEMIKTDGSDKKQLVSIKYTDMASYSEQEASNASTGDVVTTTEATPAATEENATAEE